jgi:hypothetical protein
MIMTQAELEREVCRVTGETRETIRRQGFSILPLPEDGADDEPNLLSSPLVDWDELDAQRRRPAEFFSPTLENGRGLAAPPFSHSVPTLEGPEGMVWIVGF